MKIAGCAGLSAPAILRAASAGADDAKLLDGAEERIARHRKGRASLILRGPGGKPLPPGVSVAISQQRHQFLFGSNIFKLGTCRTPEDNARYAERFSALMNFATLPFYWWTYERSRGQTDDPRSLETARWCREHGILPKGHPLAWNFIDPPWMREVPDKDVLRLEIERAGRLVAKFKGIIDTWDVVNEATHYDRDECWREAPKLTRAVRESGIGEYVRQAFRAARRANPGATLLINDYRTDPGYETRVLRELVDEGGRPLYDAVGIQSHMHGGCWTAAKTWEICERFAKFGKPLHFTEATIVSGPKTPGGWKTTAAGEKVQAGEVREFYTLLFSHPAVRALTWWDFSDQDAWQNAPAGLVREDMSPKPAYEALMELVKGRWWTRTEAKVQPGGAAAFDGFFGDYEAIVQHGGQRLTGRFTHAAPGAPIEVPLA